MFVTVMDIIALKTKFFNNLNSNIMKNSKVILFALCVCIISLLNACQKDYGVTEIDATPTIEVSSNSGGLRERCTAQQMGSGHFTTLRYTPNGTRSFTSNTGGVNLTWTANSTNSTIQFSPRTQLATVLSTPSGSQAHHIIPWQHVDDYGGSGSSLKSSVKAAAYAGFHPNNTYNGINLSTTIHNGSHFYYNDYVLFQLNAWASNNNINLSYTNIVECQTANTWIQCKLIPHLRGHISSAISQNKPIATYFTVSFPTRSYIGN